MSDERRQRSTDPANDASVPPDGVERNETLIRPDGHLDAETLSAWLDSPDDFTDADRRAIEAHLVDCADCSLVLGDLAAIVGALQAVALVEPPRSFALTAAQAGLPTPIAAHRLQEPAFPHERRLTRERNRPVELYEPTPWYERQMRALRWATAVAALLFVFILSADLLGNIGSYGSDDDDDSAPAEAVYSTTGGAMPTTAAAAQEDAGAEDSTNALMMATEEAGTSARSAAEPTPQGTTGTDGAGAPAAPTATTAAGSAEPTPTPAAMAASEPTAAAESTTGEDAQGAGDAPDDEDSALSEPAAQDGATPAGETVEPVAIEELDDDSRSTLRLIQFGLAVIIVWLLAAMIALPRLRRPRR